MSIIRMEDICENNRRNVMRLQRDLKLRMQALNQEQKQAVRQMLERELCIIQHQLNDAQQSYQQQIDIMRKKAHYFDKGSSSLQERDETEMPPSELKLISPPGYKILSWLEVLVSPKKYEQVYEPIIADWNEEYLEAVDNERSKAKLIAIRIRYTWALIASFGFDFAVLDKVVRFFTK